MLPLWIIDLNNKKEQREKLRDMVDSLRVFDEPLLLSVKPRNEPTGDDSGKAGNGSVAKTYFYPKVNWCYTECPEIGLSEDWLDVLLETVVKAGQDYVRSILEHSPSNECLANVCIIGDVTETWTLKVFTSLAAIIKNEKGRIIPAHVHQGIDIVGFLYVPSNVNTLPYEQRQGVLRCIKELEVQGRVNRVKGYDRIMLYQDTQHRTQKFYPALDANQKVEYLFQCLINMYYACDSGHPLLNGRNATEDFFCCLGVGSLYYDSSKLGRDDVLFASRRFVEIMKDKPTMESEASVVDILPEKDYLPEDYLKRLPNVKTDGTEASDAIFAQKKPLVRDPDPHPLGDFKAKFLKRHYYGLYLRRYPAEFINRLSEKISTSVSDQLIKINDSVDSFYDVLANSAIPSGISSFFKSKISPERGCFVLLKSKFEQLKVNFIKIRDERIRESVDEMVWKPIEEQIPKKFSDYFEEYHDAYRDDLNSDNGMERCSEMKRNTMAKLVGLLRKTPTVLSMVARSFLLGIILVLVVMPFIGLRNAGAVNSLDSYRMEYYGDPQWYYFFIASSLFLIPALGFLVYYIVNERKIGRLQNQLVAYYVHDAKARVVNRILTCLMNMYTDLSDLMAEYVDRCDRIIDEKDIINEREYVDSAFPFLKDSLFNQPINGGTLLFRKDESEGSLVKRIFPDDETIKSYFSVNGGNATRLDHLTVSQYYSIAHSSYMDMSELLKGVALERRVKVERNSATSQSIKSREELLKEKEDRWITAKDIFSNAIFNRFKSMQLPIPDQTMAHKLRTIYKYRPERHRDFELFANFCAPNGEFANNDDIMYADVKSNSSMFVKEAFGPYLPQNGRTDFQVDDKYQHYLFLTEWRAVDEVALKRIIPEQELENKSFVMIIVIIRFLR